MVSEDANSEFTREGGLLLTDATSLLIVYIFDQTDVAKWSASFIKAFWLDLAIEACYSLTQDKVLKQSIMDEREQFMGEARSYDSQENNSEEVVVDSFFRGRGEVFDPSKHGF